MSLLCDEVSALMCEPPIDSCRRSSRKLAVSSAKIFCWRLFVRRLLVGVAKLTVTLPGKCGLNGSIALLTTGEARHIVRGVGEFTADEQPVRGRAGGEGPDHVALQVAAIMLAILRGGVAGDQGAVDEVRGNGAAVDGLESRGVVVPVETGHARGEVVIEAVGVLERQAMHDVLAPVQRLILAEGGLPVDRDDPAGALVKGQAIVGREVKIEVEILERDPRFRIEHVAQRRREDEAVRVGVIIPAAGILPRSDEAVEELAAGGDRTTEVELRTVGVEQARLYLERPHRRRRAGLLVTLLITPPTGPLATKMAEGPL